MVSTNITKLTYVLLHCKIKIRFFIYIKKSEGIFLDKKIIMIILGILGIVTLPVKIILEFINPNYVRSTVFAVIFSVCVFLMMILSSRLAKHEQNNSPMKNMPLAIVSFLCSCSHIWGFISYFKGPAPDDNKFQYFFLSILSILSSLFFLFVSYSHYSGKNLFKKFQILLFCPILFYLVSLTVFFSFEIGTPSAYNVAGQSLILMFLVYYSNYYVTCSKKVLKQRSFVFGIPAAIVSASYSIPALCLNSFGSINSVTSIVYLMTAVYISLFLASRLKQPVGEKSFA